MHHRKSHGNSHRPPSASMIRDEGRSRRIDFFRLLSLFAFGLSHRALLLDIFSIFSGAFLMVIWFCITVEEEEKKQKSHDSKQFGIAAKNINLVVSQSDRWKFPLQTRAFWLLRCTRNRNKKREPRMKLYRGNRMQFTINGNGAQLIDDFTHS